MLKKGIRAMGFFESNDYQRNAVTELERRFRDAEEEKKKNGKADIAVLQANLDFANDARLLKAQQMEMFQKRLNQIAYDEKNRRYMREVSGEAVDGFTNPHEMAKKFATMEQAQSQIDSERSHESTERANEQSAKVSQKARNSEERERGI